MFPVIGIVHTVLVLLVLIALNEVVRKSKWIAIVCYIVLPAILTPLFFVPNATAPGSSVNSWFDWAKTYSVLMACLWYTGLNYTKLGNHNWAKFIAAAILAINIGEAVARDLELFFAGDAIGMFGVGQAPNGQYMPYHMMNAIAGILSIITLSGWRGMHMVSNGKKGSDFLWPDLQVLWIIAYDVWNFAYIYNCVPIHAAFGFMVLSACTIPSLLIRLESSRMIGVRGTGIAPSLACSSTIARWLTSRSRTSPSSQATAVSGP